MTLKKRLKKSFRILRAFAENSDGDAGTRTAGENFYLIEQAYRGCDIKRVDPDGLYARCVRYLGRNGWKCEPKTFFEFFGGESFSLCEIYALRSALDAALIISAAEEAGSYAQSGRSDAQKLINSVVSLHRTGDIRPEKCFRELCRAEKALCEKVELYSQSDRPTRDACREAVIKCAARRRISEKAAVEYLASLPGGVYSAARGKTHKAAYFALFSALFVPIFGASVTAFGFYALFSALPVFLLCGFLCDRVFSHIVKPFRTFRLDVRSGAASAKTLVVYAVLLTGGENDDAVFAELENAYLRNRDHDTVFGVLGDFCDSRDEFAPSDLAVTERAVRRINALNDIYGEKFALFLREREYDPADKIWRGKERKRGAVCALARTVCGVEGLFEHTVNAGAALGARFILTLDSDTVLPLGAVRELTSAALHPANRPVIKNGRVISGSAVLQPKMKTGLIKRHATRFTLLRSEYDTLYETAAYDRWQSLFGRGGFCGKGLIDAAAFVSLACGAFPENRILSHDIPEGCVLGCMLVPDVTFTDSSPKDPVSSFSRLHRWIRGDIQNLSLLSSRQIDFLGKYMLAENAVRHLAPVTAAAGAFTFAFFSPYPEYASAVYAALLLSHTLVPALFSLSGVILSRQLTPRRFFSAMLTSSRWIVFNLLYELCAFVQYALCGADAALRSAWRVCVSHRKTLEWTAFSQTDSLSSGLMKHISAFFGCAAAGILLAAFSRYAVFTALGIAAFLMPLASYFSAARIKQKSVSFTEKQKEKLVLYAREMYSFFAERVGRSTNWLPPDNLQLSPVETVAERTSPTNIGLYLLCVAASREFGFTDTSAAEEAIGRTLSTVESLRKYRGNLFNWYDTRSLCVIGEEYVSTVDSGNLVTMLVTLAAFLRAFGTPSADILALRAEKLAHETDLEFLFDGERELFFLGYTVGKGADTGHYDTLMSEIRTTCYYACAEGITPKAHWNALSRAVAEKNGYAGMVSWSGSAFEYFMPQLFLPAFPNSFLDETLSFAAYCQRIHRREKLWGVSESGYYAFDADMNYQYKAHGVPALALKKYDPDEFVVSPYSVFLMLERAPEAALKELSLFENRGAHGEYGFYEAIDLSGGGIVRSYMSHHLGMSMLACANVCLDGIVRKRFFRDKAIAACAGLLCESIPADVRLVPPRRGTAKEKPQYAASRRRFTCDTAHPECALIRGGNLSLAASSDGRIALRCGAYAVNYAEFRAFSPYTGVTFGVVCGGRPIACLPDGKGFSAEFYRDGFAFVSSSGECPVAVKGGVTEGCGAFVFDVRADPLAAESVCMNFTPVLDKSASYASHPAFSRLFVTSSYLQNENAVIFRRRTEPGGSRYPLCAVALGNRKTRYEKRDNCLSLRSHARACAAETFVLPYDFADGACIEPDCTLRVPTPPDGKVRFIIACGYTVREVLAAIETARSAKTARARPACVPALTTAAVSACMFPQGVNAAPSGGISALWKAGVSGDYPLMTLEIYGKNEAAADSLAEAYKAINGAFFRCELLFLIHEPRGYSMPLTEWIKAFIASHGLERYSGRRGGVFAANADGFTESELTHIREFSAFRYESDSVPAAVREYRLPAPRVIRGTTARLSEKLAPPSVFVSGTPPLPRSYVMAGFALGALVTEKTLGFTFFGSARDRRISSFGQDPHAPCCGEELLMLRGGNVYDLVSLSSSVEYRDGAARYTGDVCGVSYRVTVFVLPKLPAKVIDAEFDAEPVKTALCVLPEEAHSRIWFPETAGTALFEPARGEDGMVCFVCGDGDCERFTDRAHALTGRSDGTCGAACVSSVSQRATYFIGAAPSVRGALAVVRELKRLDPAAAARTACAFARSFIPNHTSFTRDGALDALYSAYAPYQTAFSRFLGRTGFYQTGGAYGFRDQLQDCLCLVYSRPDLVRTHLLRCAAHQYAEGDVMHWWLRHVKSTGTRTACSDDLLYLPLAVADYCEKTGDLSVLDVKIPYLSSPPLAGGERFETASRSDLCESLYLHCIRALLCAAGRTGAHGLSLMGSCDWNDGFSAVGREGRGESVFTTFLLACAAREFARVCAQTGDTNGASALEKIYRRAAEAGRKSYTGDRFPRGTFDDGSFFGVKGCRECEIDVISQGLAAAALGNTQQTADALNAAYRELYDGKKRVFKLFSPPFDTVDAGYISAYPPGVRENGGQYTHGALWGVMGLVICGEYEKAWRLIRDVTPAGHTDAEEYKVEPYVIAADIAPSGRGGWSWYTGASAWFYKIMTEYIMGIRFSDSFTRVAVTPACEYTFLCERNGYKLKIISSRAEEYPTLDGAKITFPLDIPAGEHVLRVKAPY